MSRRLPFLLRCALFCGAGLLAATAQARMESLDDDQLSDVVGQPSSTSPPTPPTD